MFELYKKRELSDYIGDTFGFFKKFGKHFFKIFIVINGVFLLLTGALIYWFISLNAEFLTENPAAKDPNILFNDVNVNLPMYIGFIVLFVIIGIFLSMFNAAYPVLYLKLVEKNNTNDFTIEDIFSVFKQSIWKILKFSLGMVFIIVPLMIIAIIVMFLLCFVIIGIPLIIISIPAFYTWLNLSFYSYLIDDRDFFESLNYSYSLLTQNFWNTIGTTFLVMIMVQMIQATITMAFYFMGIFVLLLTAATNSNFDKNPFDGSPLLIIFISSLSVTMLALSYLCSNVLMVNQGIIYYSLSSDEKTSTRDIELIGTDNE